MPTVVACRGAPRDQGLDQGRACAVAVRHEVDAASVGTRVDRAARRRAAAASREVRRHFPQVFERLAGLARGALVSRAALARRLAAELGDPPVAHLRAGGAALIGADPARSGGGPLIARTVDLPALSPPLEPIVRRTHHDPGFMALDVTLPGLPVALAGVNAAGLAVAVASAPPPAGVAAAAPALCLVQECLQRFESVERALDWCMRRPVGGRATLVVADAGGGLGGLEITGAAAAPRAPRDGLLLGVGRPARTERLELLCRDARRLDAAGLHGVLRAHAGGAGGDDAPCRHGERVATAAVVWLDPAARRLGILREPACRRDAGAVEYVSV